MSFVQISNGIKNLDDLKSLIDCKVKEETESVSTIYVTYIRPFGTSGGDFSEFITSNEVLFQFPPGIVKIRRFFLQILLLIDIFHSLGKPDPLPDENMKEVLFLIRSIAPLAPVISGSMLFGIFEELHLVHGDHYPQTILYLMKSIGLTANNVNEELFKNQESNPRRVHYEDGESIPTGLEFQPNKTLLQNYPLFQNSNNEKRTIKIPKHGPKINMKLNC